MQPLDPERSRDYWQSISAFGVALLNVEHAIWGGIPLAINVATFLAVLVGLGILWYRETSRERGEALLMIVAGAASFATYVFFVVYVPWVMAAAMIPLWYINYRQACHKQ